MIVVNSVDEIKEDFGLTIGNFDGVHLGHRELIQELRGFCEGFSAKLAVMTFNPHPSQIIHPNRKSFLLNSAIEKRSLMESIGVDYLIEIPFDRDFSTLSPENFMHEKILSNSSLKVLHLGYDFVFGAHKAGNHELVKELVEGRDIKFSIQKELKDGDQIISSTLIREYLDQGYLEKAKEALGRPYFTSGTVIKGVGRGKQIGFPTANIETRDERKYPGFGVYITLTKYKDRSYHSITNVGVNPTFEGSNPINIETNIFDFDQDIYGECINVSFLKKIRDEQKFDSVNALIDQIKKDVEVAKSFHNKG